MNGKKTFLGIAILLPLMITTLTGCGKDVDDKTPYNQILTESCSYNDLGEYTTTLNLDDTSNLTKDDIKIRAKLDGDDVLFGPVKVEKQDTEKPGGYYYEIPCENLVIKDNKSVEIKFKDNKQDERNSHVYQVVIESKRASGLINILEQKAELTSDLKYLENHANTQKISLNLKHSSFIGDLKTSDIMLDGSISNCEVSSISNSKNNLTIQLKGEPMLLAQSNSYIPGKIVVNRDVIANAKSDAIYSIDIEPNNVYIDASKLTYSSKGLLVPVNLNGIYKPSEISKTDITFQKDVTVSEITSDENTLNLLCSVKGATDLDSAADIINSQLITIKDRTLVCDTVKATFTPVFNSIEKVGDNFLLDLKLYASAGTFNNVKASDVTLTSDFKEGNVERTKKDSDTILDLLIKIPHHDVKVEDLDLDGGITLPNGAMNNRWKTLSKSLTSFRNYGLSNLGKLFDNYYSMTNNFLVLGGFVGKGAELFGNVGTAFNLVGSVFSIFKSFLELTGVIEDDKRHTERMFNEMGEYMTSLFGRQENLIRDLSARVEIGNISAFHTTLNETIYWNNLLNEITEYAMADLNVKRHKHYTDEQFDIVQKAIYDYCIEECDAGNPKFKQYRTAMNKLQELYVKVCAAVSITSQDNPIYTYDRMCAATYNFATTTERPRQVFRSLIKSTLLTAICHLLIFNEYQSVNNPCTTLTNSYLTAMKVIDKTCEGFIGKNGDTNTIYIHSMDLWLFNSAEGMTNENIYRCVGAYQQNFQKFDINNEDMKMPDAKITRFITCMAGSTIKEEFALSRINGNGYGEGVAFKTRLYHEWVGDVFFREYYHTIMKWDSKELEVDEYQGYSENHRKVITRVWKWLVSPTKKSPVSLEGKDWIKDISSWKNRTDFVNFEGLGHRLFWDE